MYHRTSLLVFVLLVGISCAYPQTRRATNRRQAVDASTPETFTEVDNSITTTPAASPRFISEVPQDPIEDGTNSLEENALGLPSNSTSIRAKIVDTFSCEDKVYGYYADVDNDCQIFHVCLPVNQPGSKGRTFKWSFICPEQTIFNQEKFTCTRPEDAPPCVEAPNYFRLNDNFGKIDKSDNTDDNDGVVVESRGGPDDVEEVGVGESTTLTPEQA